jgi:hypothetical protein
MEKTEVVANRDHLKKMCPEFSLLLLSLPQQQKGLNRRAAEGAEVKHMHVLCVLCDSAVKNASGGWH